MYNATDHYEKIAAIIINYKRAVIKIACNTVNKSPNAQ